MLGVVRIACAGGPDLALPLDPDGDLVFERLALFVARDRMSEGFHKKLLERGFMDDLY
jgi:hypothetical protein